MSKTLYLWDLGNTLFVENWSLELSGFATLEDYFRSRGFDPGVMSERDWEWEQEEPYKKGWYCQDIFPGFKELLEFTKNNEVFTRGNKEQLDWRAQYLNPKVGFDISKLFVHCNSAIDGWGTNVKNPQMLKELVQEKYKQGNNTLVYSDDSLKNGQMFLDAAREIKDTDPKFKYRFYHCLHDGKELRSQNHYWEIGSLFDIFENEQKIYED